MNWLHRLKVGKTQEKEASKTTETLFVVSVAPLPEHFESEKMVSTAANAPTQAHKVIRSSKAPPIDCPMTSDEAAGHAYHAPDKRQAWNELAAVYHAHHFQCPTCIAAGRSARYGQRCSVGMALWLKYLSEFDSNNF